MGGRVTFLAFESPSISRNIDFGPFLTFFHVFFEKKFLSPSPKLKFSMRGFWVEKFKTSFQSPGPIPLDRPYPLTWGLKEIRSLETSTTSRGGI